MKKKQVYVTKTNISMCSCCNDVREFVSKAQEDYITSYKEKYPDTSLCDYEIRYCVAGVAGYEITTDLDNWRDKMCLCEHCHDAMLLASKAIQSSKLLSASVETVDKPYQIIYDNEIIKEYEQKEKEAQEHQELEKVI